MQKYGLIGKTLSYSFSKIIHEKLFNIYNIDATYDLIEVDTITKELLLAYNGLNVTIPYKQTVLQYLAKNHCPFDSCNTIKNMNGALSGYNTDISGFDFMMKKLPIFPIKKVVILGSGASSKMLQYYFKDKEVIVISRQDQYNNYQQLPYVKADILINATPVGMAEYKSPITEDIVQNFQAILDLNYNPLNSQLAHFCQRQNKPFLNGLMMLIEQAIKAFEIWHNITVEQAVFTKIYRDICFLVNTKIAIVGMPLAGKTTMIRTYGGVDLDDAIEAQTNQRIPNLLEKGIFRDTETQVLKNLVEQEIPLIALGGGAVLKQENIELLKDYLIVFLDTPLEILKERSQINYRPLIKTEQDLLNLFEQRYPIYQKVANIHLDSEVLSLMLRLKEQE